MVAYTTFTNEGCVLPVSFYKQDSKLPTKCQQVISAHTADEIRDILAKNTVRGTGQNAQLADYTTGGKTGTAQKMVNGHYSEHDHIASFVGFAPAVAPRVIIAIMIDSPKGTYYGAAVSAPVFSKIAGPTLHLLGVKPGKQ